MNVRDRSPSDLFICGLRIDIVQDVHISIRERSWRVQTIVANSLASSVVLSQCHRCSGGLCVWEIRAVVLITWMLL